MQLASLAIVLAGCGRLGFGEGSFGDAPIDDPDGAEAMISCNVPVAIGAISDLLPDSSGSRWMAATTTPNGLVVTYTTASGLTAVTVDLAAIPASLGLETTILQSSRGNLQVAADADRLLFTTNAAGAGTTVAITDFALAPIGAMGTEATVDLAAPDNAVGRPGGGYVVVGSSSLAQVTTLDDDCGYVTDSTYNIGGAVGGSITSVPGGGYAASWYPSPQCHVKVFDETLGETNNVQINGCDTAARIAATPAGDRIGVSWGNGAAVIATTYTNTLTGGTGTVTLAATTLEPTRLAASADGFWVVFPSTYTSLIARLVTPAGAASTTVALAPYASAVNEFTYDVVSRNGRAYGVWISQLTAPTLYVERLCP